MGLLDRWTKKKQKEQLEETKVEKTVKTEAKKEEKVAEKEVVTTKKTTAKSTAKKAVKETKEVKAEKTEKAKVSALADRILVAPLITEKSAIMASENKYGFIVKSFATKFQVKKAVSEVYGVTPLSVNVINVQGKQVRFGRHAGRRSDYKKAFVTLPKGKTINVHEGV